MVCPMPRPARSRYLRDALTCRNRQAYNQRAGGGNTAVIPVHVRIEAMNDIRDYLAAKAARITDAVGTRFMSGAEMLAARPSEAGASRQWRWSPK